MGNLFDPFQFEFFRNGLFVATIAGGLCGLIGVYVVLRGMSYIGHGLSHAIFGGFAASGLIGVNFFLGAGVWGLASALMVSAVTRRRIIGSDAAIGVITTASFALGLALIQLYGSPGRNPDAALFGNVLGVASEDVWIVVGVSAFAAAVIFLRYRALLFTTFDPEVAEASGVNTARVDALLMLVLAASILATMSVMGVTLVAASIVVPAAVARMLTDSFSRDVVAVDADRRGLRVRRDEPQLPPRRGIGPHHRPDGLGPVRGGVRGDDLYRGDRSGEALRACPQPVGREQRGELRAVRDSGDPVALGLTAHHAKPAAPRAGEQVRHLDHGAGGKQCVDRHGFSQPCRDVRAVGPV